MAEVFAFSGTHGTGKTTAVFELAHQLKIDHPEKTVWTLQEVAPQCPLGINRGASIDAQKWIFTAQMEREIRMGAHCDILVCDRTVMDAIAYTAVLSEEGARMAEVMYEFARSHLKSYDHVRYLSAEANKHHVADGVRDMDEKWRMDVDTVLKWLWRRSEANDFIDFQVF